MKQVPRHRFVSHVDLATAYADRAVMVKHAHDGTAISSSSQPTMVAMMLEHLQIVPGHRVLEIGTGTGYNAALLSVLVGEHGSVVSVELEPDLAEQARRLIGEVVSYPVEVVVGDGQDGYPRRAPYDRIVVTAGASEVAEAWRQQLATGGRLVVPIVGRRGAGSVMVFDVVNGNLVRRAAIPCGFVPMRHVPDS